MMTETEQKQTMDNTEKGITIALIDDAVDETFRRQCGMDYIDFTGEPETHQYGHASVCARLILNRCPAAKIINLRVLKDGWTANDTGAFRKALQYCLENDVAVISMSIGTTDLNEQKGLVPLLKALHSQGKIMIAAIQNEDKVSLPASLPYVTGVKADHACLLEEGTFVKCKANPPGIDIVMNIMEQASVRGFSNCNSYAAASYTGYIAKKTNDGAGICEKETDYPLREPFLLFDDLYLPVVAFYGEADEKEVDELIEQSEKRDHVPYIVCQQADSQKRESDLRLCRFDEDTDLKGVFCQIQKRVECDVIFLFSKQCREEITPDLIITRKEQRYCLRIPEEETEWETDSLVQTIERMYALLEEEET